MNTDAKERESRLSVKLWEGVGIISIGLLIYLPGGKTIIETMCGALKVEVNTIYGISSANAVAIVIFLAVYFSSVKIFIKEPCTKLFSRIASAMMIVTLVCAALFA